jgi:hypothetical protein
MKKLMMAAAFFILAASACAPKIYKAEEFNQVTASHKIVAILPAEVSITLRPNEMKKVTKEQLTEMEEKTGNSIR